MVFRKITLELSQHSLCCSAILGEAHCVFINEWVKQILTPMHITCAAIFSHNVTKVNKKDKFPAFMEVNLKGGVECR